MNRFNCNMKDGKFVKTEFFALNLNSRKSNSYRVQFLRTRPKNLLAHKTLFIVRSFMRWHIFLLEKMLFSWSYRLQNASGWGVQCTSKKMDTWRFQLCTLASLVFNEIFSVQLPSHKVYTDQISRHSDTVVKKYTIIT